MTNNLYHFRQDSLVHQQQEQNLTFPINADSDTLSLRSILRLEPDTTQQSPTLPIDKTEPLTNNTNVELPAAVVVRPQLIPIQAFPVVAQADSVIKSDSLHTVIQEIIPVREGLSGEARHTDNLSSITLFIIVGLALLAVIRYNYGTSMRILQMLRSFIDYRLSVRMYEERRESDRQATIFSNILLMWMVGIFISVLLPFFGSSPLWGSYTLSVLFFSTATGLVYLLKAGVWHILSVIFQTRDFSKAYIYNMFLFNQNISWIIFAPVAMIPYIEKQFAIYLIYSIFTVFVIAYLCKLWRIFLIIYNLNVSVLYFILYLCTLEILPLLLFVKGCKMLIEFNLFL